MLFMRRLGRLAWSGVARPYDHTREQNGADARGCQARQVPHGVHRPHHSTP
jgi:hypothetical protein